MDAATRLNAVLSDRYRTEHERGVGGTATGLLYYVMPVMTGETLRGAVIRVWRCP